MKFLKANWGNLLFIVVLGLLLIPQTGLPIKVFVQRIVSFAPSVTDAAEREAITNYHWPLQTLEGEWENFSASEDRVVVLNYWATWCPPCIAEMPSLQSLYDRYGDAVDFYFVTSEDSQKVARFLRKKGYDLPVYIQSLGAPSGLTSEALPTTYVISKKGRVAIRKTGAARWDAPTVTHTLDTLLAD